MLQTLELGTEFEVGEMGFKLLVVTFSAHTLGDFLAPLLLFG
jgi:hypothetical protein